MGVTMIPESIFVVAGNDGQEDFEWDDTLWAGTSDGYSGAYSEQSCTFSPQKGMAGWNTDGGHPGYGPPESVLNEVVRRYNAHNTLVASLREAIEYIQDGVLLSRLKAALELSTNAG